MLIDIEILFSNRIYARGYEYYKKGKIKEVIEINNNENLIKEYEKYFNESYEFRIFNLLLKFIDIKMINHSGRISSIQIASDLLYLKKYNNMTTILEEYKSKRILKDELQKSGLI